MPATSTRTSNCRIKARRTPARLTALIIAGTSACANADTLRIERTLQRRELAPAIASDAPIPLQLRLAQEVSTGRPAPTYEEMLLEVDVNEQKVNAALLVLRRDDGMFLLKRDDLAAFRLVTPSTAPYMHDGAPFFALDAFPGARFRMDPIHQRLFISMAPGAFESTQDVVPLGPEYPRAVRPTLGGFLNYDVVATTGGGITSVSDLMEGGLFTRYGVLVGSLLAAHDGASTRAVRLDSTFTSDFPSRHTTLRIGDWQSRAGAWGNIVRFGGVAYGTNFSTDPAFRPFPSQALRGQAVVPSLVDVYVNNALVATRSVEPGPFTISNIPFTTGAGTVRLAVRDLANQQQVYTISDPFYSSNTMLKAGLADYSAEAGKVREDYGFESFRYGDAFAVGTLRYGVTDRVTAEIRGEAASGQRAVGASTSLVHPRVGQLDVTVAASQSDAGSGRLAGLGFQRQVTPLSFGAQAQWASPAFRRLGETGNDARLREQQAVSLGLQLGNYGATTATYVAQRFTDRAAISIVTLAYTLSLGHWGSLNVSALRSRGEQDGTAFTIGYTLPLETNTNASAQYDAQRSGPDRSRALSLSYQHNRVGDSPYSYHVSSRGSDLEGVVHYRGDRAEAELGASRVQGQAIGRAEIAGGIGTVGGYTFLSRRITSSFGVVQVADYPDVAVLFDNQFIGRTNDRGFFVIPDMRPYDRNIVAIRDTDLPLDATVGSLKMDASPYFRSGILIQFPVRRVRAGVLYLTFDDGMPLNSGALARLEGGAEEFPVALRGELYMNGFAAGRNRVIAEWKGQKCTIELPYPETADPLPDLGTFVCKGVQP